MSSSRSRWLFWVMLFVPLSIMCDGAYSGADQYPRVFVIDRHTLRSVKQAVENEDPRFKPALQQLKRQADQARRKGPFSVVDKTAEPLSGDPHDYMSVGPYWWPNPDSDDGLPYIRKDGERNPESRDDTFDARRNKEMTDAVRTLALAYYFTEQDNYGEHAAEILRTWFLDSDSRMNPNMNYAQAIPGRRDGRGFGIIENANWVHLIDAVGLIERSRHWTCDDQEGLEAWFREYLLWLKNSGPGHEAQSAENNHGIWFDAQILAVALFVGEDALGERQVHNWTKGRIDSHFASDGGQPNELTRAQSWNYSVYNLRGFAVVAQLSQHYNIDLWHYRAQDDISIRCAIKYLTQYIDHLESWPHEQAGDISTNQLARKVLPLAAKQYEGAFAGALKSARNEELVKSLYIFKFPYMYEKYR